MCWAILTLLLAILASLLCKAILLLMQVVREFK